MVVHPGAVLILPLLDARRVVMIRNRRFAIDRELLELPAGTMEPPEEPMACAARELEEETGYIAGRLVPCAVFSPHRGSRTSSSTHSSRASWPLRCRDSMKPSRSALN